MSRIPRIYRHSIVRCVTPCDGEFIGIAFDGDDDVTSRVRLSKQDAVQLADLIRSHSDVCSGIPSVDVSSSSPVTE